MSHAYFSWVCRFLQDHAVQVCTALLADQDEQVRLQAQRLEAVVEGKAQVCLGRLVSSMKASATASLHQQILRLPFLLSNAHALCHDHTFQVQPLAQHMHAVATHSL